MSFGSTSETIGYEIIFGLGLLASFPVVILLTILLRWLLRIQSGWFSVIFIGLIYIGGVLGASYYLDIGHDGECRSSKERRGDQLS